LENHADRLANGEFRSEIAHAFEQRGRDFLAARDQKQSLVSCRASPQKPAESLGRTNLAATHDGKRMIGVSLAGIRQVKIESNLQRASAPRGFGRRTRRSIVASPRRSSEDAAARFRGRRQCGE